MKILIAGATGLIGKALVRSLLEQHTLGLLGRDLRKLNEIFADRECATFDWQMMKDRGAEIIKDYDVVINLAGENIGEHRWSKSQKGKILNSRTTATRLLANLCVATNNSQLRLLNASAIGVYDFAPAAHQFNKIFTEEMAPSNPQSFVGKVGKAWEAALAPAENKLSVVKMRFGVVLAKDGGALAKQLLPFKLGLGAIVGSGNQPLSWVSLTDVVRAIQYIIEDPTVTGAVNIVAPTVVTQREFSKSLAHYLKRPLFLKLPAAFIKLAFGEMGTELLLNGQNVSSSKLLKHGFHFHTLTIAEALAED